MRSVIIRLILSLLVRGRIKTDWKSAPKTLSPESSVLYGLIVKFCNVGSDSVGRLRQLQALGGMSTESFIGRSCGRRCLSPLLKLLRTIISFWIEGVRYSSRLLR